MNTVMMIEAFSNLDDDLVEKHFKAKEALKVKKANKNKSMWIKWGSMAACLLMVCASFFLINHLINDPTQPGGDVKVKIDYLDIYYVSENGTIESDNVYIHYEPQTIFEEWAKLNNLTGVELIGCTKGENELKIEVGTQPDAVDFSTYVEAENGELLIEALKKTFYGYWQFDKFELLINEIDHYDGKSFNIPIPARHQENFTYSKLFLFSESGTISISTNDVLGDAEVLLDVVLENRDTNQTECKTFSLTSNTPIEIQVEKDIYRYSISVSVANPISEDIVVHFDTNNINGK